MRRWWRVDGRGTRIGLATLATFVGWAGGLRAQSLDDALASGRIVRAAVEAPGESPGDLVQAMADARVPGVSIAVLRAGTLAWSGGFGTTVAGGSGPVGATTPFQVASLSKPVAGAVAGELARRGVVDPGADVNDLVPDLARDPDGAPVPGVTLERLLRHVAGVRPVGFEGHAAHALPDLDAVIDGRVAGSGRPIRVEAPPGEVVLYSGGGYVLAQRVLEAVSGRTFGALAVETVLGPVGMRGSGYDDAGGETGRARGHGRDGAQLPGGWRGYVEEAAAGLWSSADDLAAFLVAVLQGLRGEEGPVHPAVAEDMLRTVPSRVGGPGFAWGAGWEIHGSGPGRYVSMTGANPGYRARLLYFVESGDGMVVLTNGDGGGPLIDGVVRGVAAQLGWPAFAPRVVESVAWDPADLERMPGRYRFGPADLVIRIRRSPDQQGLELALPWTPFRALIATSEGYVTEDGSDVRFERAVDADRVMVHLPGQPPLIGRREPG